MFTASSPYQLGLSSAWKKNISPVNSGTFVGSSPKQSILPSFGKSGNFVPTCDTVERQLPGNANYADSFPDVFQTHKKLTDSIARHAATPEAVLQPMASRFSEVNHPALFAPETDTPQFHKRNAYLNQIPLFFSTFGTEIPKPEELKVLPPKEKQAALIRLIAKRYLNLHEDENKYASFLTQYNIGKSSPTMQMQEMPVRLIRGEAGTASVSQYSGKYIQDLYDHLVKNVQFPANANSPITVYLVRPGRDKYANDCSTNFLTLATQGVITDALNDLARRNGMSGRIRFSDQKQLPGIVRSSRTNATPIERIVLQGYYDTSQIKKGDQIVLVDDHCQAGGTFLGMAAAVSSRGANVMAAITPTAHPLCSTFSLSPEVNALLSETLRKWDSSGLVKGKLAEYGIPLASLTNHEAMIIIAYATDPDDKLAKQKFKSLEEKLYQSSHVLSGESDSLEPILKKKPLTATAIADKMTAASTNARTVTKAVPVKAVHVLDWDDFLCDEKGKNYELMHRAIAMSAHNYGDRYPFLVSLAKAMQANRGNYRSGMPELCMDEKAYTNKTIQNDKAQKRDAIKDLLGHLDTLSPWLQQEFESIRLPAEETTTHRPKARAGQHEQSEPLTGQQAINNILWSEFKRQYQSMLRPEAQKLPATLKHGLELPFPNVRPTLMPGAKELMEKLRRPGNFVVLLSNRPESELTKELNALGVAHYFDVTSGKPTVLLEENGKPTLKSKKYNKPNPDRLNEIISQQHNLDGATWGFWGDTGKDITQVLPLVREGKIPAHKIKGYLINPNTAIWQKTKDELHKGSPETQGVEIISAKSLSDLSSLDNYL